MAIISSLAIGKAKKSAGNLRYQTVKGRTIVAQKPVHVANPNTKKQQAVRGRMSNVVKLYRALNGIVSKSIKVKNKYASIYNTFCSENIKNMPNEVKETVFDLVQALDKPIIYSNGTIPAPTVSAPSGGYIVNFEQALPYLDVGDYAIKTYFSEISETFVTEEKVLSQSDLENGDVSIGAHIEDSKDAAFYLVKADGRDSSTQGYYIDE